MIIIWKVWILFVVEPLFRGDVILILAALEGLEFVVTHHRRCIERPWLDGLHYLNGTILTFNSY